MRKERIDTAESDMVEHLRSVDTLVHYIIAKRAGIKGYKSLGLREWDRIYNRLLQFIGTNQAKQLIEMGKS